VREGEREYARYWQQLGQSTGRREAH